MRRIDGAVRAAANAVRGAVGAVPWRIVRRDCMEAALNAVQEARTALSWNELGVDVPQNIESPPDPADLLSDAKDCLAFAEDRLRSALHYGTD